MTLRDEVVCCVQSCTLVVCFEDRLLHCGSNTVEYVGQVVKELRGNGIKFRPVDNRDALAVAGLNTPASGLQR
jgi:hypothetical protein